MLRPIQRRDWTTARAAHLLNRAGFSAPPFQVNELASLPPEEAVSSLLDFEKIPEKFDPPSWVVPGVELRPDREVMRQMTEEDRRKLQREMRADQNERLFELRAWWIYRMRYSPRPLQEKLTLFWHGHFATSAEKVRNTYALYVQNETFRRHAAGNFRDLVVAVAQDPAMLIYLDNAQSRRQAPNENFARELMELFTLGEGHYTEDDIKESARAFTGWSLHSEKIQFVSRRRMHDDGTKTFMGQRGNLDGADIIDIILRQPQAAKFICAKLWRFFAASEPTPEMVKELAATLRTEGYEIKPFLRRMFLAQEFYAKPSYRTQIKSPVQWLIGSLNQLEAPPPNAEHCIRALRLLGQDLFAPPNVKGWEGGYAWMTTAALMQRYNFAGLLLEENNLINYGPQGQRLRDAIRRRRLYGDLPDQEDALDETRASLVDIREVAPESVRGSTQTLLDHLQWRLFQSELRAKDRKLFEDFMDTIPEAQRMSDESVRKVVHAMMSTPQYQLC